MSITLHNKIPLKIGYIGEISSLQLGLEDEDGNKMVIYKAMYYDLPEAVKSFVSSKATNLEKINFLKENKINLLTYFSEKNLKKYTISNIESVDKIPGIRSDNNLQNCVVVNKNKVYVHPKIKGDPSCSGVNHSSLCNGRSVDFAGSLKNKNGRWTLTNETGHYGTRPSKIIACLKAFQENNISIADLDIEHWILIDKSRPDDNSSYLIETLPATTMLDRIEKLSQSLLETINPERKNKRKAE